MSTINTLTNQFLVAMPSLKEELFDNAVMYMYEHDDQGAMAFIINKPMPITIGDILRQLNIEVKDPRANEVPIYQGGPVSKEQLYIVQYHDKKGKTNNEDMSLVQPQELLEAFAEGKGFDNVIAFLGYAGWYSGQLEKEIIGNDWLVCPAEKQIMFETPVEDRWQTCITHMGIDLERLSSHVGHA